MTTKLTRAEEQAYADLAKAAKRLRRLQERKSRCNQKPSPKSEKGGRLRAG